MCTLRLFKARAIPPILAGKDVVGLAQTGTGGKRRRLRCLSCTDLKKFCKKRRGIIWIAVLFASLILSPTRELAVQIDKAVRNYGENLTTPLDLCCRRYFAKAPN